MAQVERLAFVGENDIYSFCFPHWDGETQDFDVASLAGIERCTELRELVAVSVLATFDASRLVGLDKLEEIDLCMDCLNPERLLDLPGLRRMWCYEDSIQDPNVITMLRERGVAVKIY